MGNLNFLNEFKKVSFKYYDLSLLSKNPQNELTDYAAETYI